MSTSLLNSTDIVTMDVGRGGWSGPMKATAEIQKICDEVKCRVEERTNKKYAEFKAVEYKEQIVAGKNYLIEVDVGGGKHIQLSIFQALSCNGGGLQVVGVQ